MLNFEIFYEIFITFHTAFEIFDEILRLINDRSVPT